MGLDSVIRKGVGIAHSVTKSLQVTVSHYPWLGQEGSGAPIFPTTPLLRVCLYERKQRRVATRSGREVVSEHQLTFLEPIAPNGATGRQEPIDERDKFVLPDGTTGPILRVEGFADAGTPLNFTNADGQTQAGAMRAFCYEVLLGGRNDA